MHGQRVTFYIYNTISIIIIALLSLFSRSWNQSPANDGKSNCGGINIQGKMSDASCNSKQGYICDIDLPGMIE